MDNEATTNPPTVARPSRSLRSRLILGGGIILLISLSAVGAVLDNAFAAATRSAIHERLENTVFLLLAVIQVDQQALGLNQLLPDERLEQPGSGLYAGVLTPEIDWRSHSALTEPHYDTGLLDAGREEFYRDNDGDGRFVLRMGLEWENEDGSLFPMTVWAAQHQADFESQMSSYRRALWPWLGAIAVLIMLVQWLGMWLSIRPLRQVESQIKAIESGAAQRLSGRYPSELKPLTDNVNALLATERGNRERYRKALGDLAHSLKTPLAVLQESLSGPTPATEELRAARGAVDDMRQTISRQLERAASAARRTHAQPIAVKPVLERLCKALDKVYHSRGIETTLDVPDAARFYGEERDFMEMAGNLLDNAYKYGKQRVQVRVNVVAAHSRRPGLSIRVDDDGPGIAEETFTRLLRRGERGDQQIEGQGLGLAIVAELLHAYDAQIHLEPSPLGGAALQINIPPL